MALPLLGYAALFAVMRSDAIRPRVQEAVHAATGRAFTLSGPIGLTTSLVPRITLDGPSLANLPGGSRPEMLRARRIEAEVALLPLLSRRVEVRSLRIIGPDLLLESDADGRPNWQLGPAARPDAVARQPDRAPATPSQPLVLDVASLTIEDGRVTWRGATTEVVEIPRLSVRAAGAETRAEGSIAARGIAARLGATMGPLTPVLRGAGDPWPVRVALSAEGVNIEANGTLDLPVAPTGWRGRLAVTADSTGRFAALAPGVAFPPAQGLSAVVEGDGAAGLRSLHVAVTRVALPPAFGNAALESVQASAPAPDAPTTITGSLRVRELSLALNAVGPNLATLRDAAVAWPVSGSLAAEGLWVEAAATLPPGFRAGRQGPVEGTLVLRVTDLQALGARSGAAVPPLHDAALDARWRIAPEGTEVPEFTLQAREGVGRGSFSVRRADPVPAVQARLAFDRLDLDGLRPGPTAAGPGAGAPEAPAPAAEAPAPGALAPNAPSPGSTPGPAPAPRRRGECFRTFRFPYPC
ncbi:AsmA family protein [Roseomonas sp. CCTCC AB2023176]|uniref:AsmA family protein n=1 Tax=Roseomonas sp. CCTCC AB2023176 TaxID=3342640 RepID=UPI0035D6C53E